MSRKFEDVVEILDYNELMRMKGDLDSGALTIKKLLQEKIRQRLKEHERVCATCSSSLNCYSSSNYTLLFGPDDFRKKASFCGLDCLEYFLIRLKRMKTKRNEESLKDNSNLL